MAKKYVKTGAGIMSDFEKYAGQEGLYTQAFFSHNKKNVKGRQKLEYIWKALRKEYKYGY